MSATEQIYNKVLFHKTAIIKNVIAVLIMAAILAFEGCFNFATLTWNIELLENPAYWVRIATKIFLLVSIKAMCFLTFMDIARRTNLDLGTQKNLNTKLMKLKGQDFPYYIENVKNREIKIEAYKKKINAQITKLEAKAKAIDRALFFTKDETKFELRDKNAYCIKRKDLEYKKSDEYIEANYEYLDITGYAHIDPAVFDMPVSIQKEKNKYQMTSKTKSTIAIIFSTSIISLVITQSIWNATGFDQLEDYNALAIFMNILIDLIFMVMQAFTGIRQAFTTIDTQEVLPYANRNRTLQEYIYWKEPNKEDKIKTWIEALENAARKEAENKNEEEGA